MVDEPQKMLSVLGRLGARLIIQRRSEEEFDTGLFLDAIYLPVRPSGPKEGVICA